MAAGINMSEANAADIINLCIKFSCIPKRVDHTKTRVAGWNDIMTGKVPDRGHGGNTAAALWTTADGYGDGAQMTHTRLTLRCALNSRLAAEFQACA